MRRTVLASATKFCPNARDGERPCEASSDRMADGECVTGGASRPGGWRLRWG